MVSLRRFNSDRFATRFSGDKADAALVLLSPSAIGGSDLVLSDKPALQQQSDALVDAGACPIEAVGLAGGGCRPVAGWRC